MGPSLDLCEDPPHVLADDAEAGDEEVLSVDESAAEAADKSRDWRDVEKYKEERALRRLVDDDLDLIDL